RRGEGILEEQDLLVVGWGRPLRVKQARAREPAAMPHAPLSASPFDEDAPHGLGGGGEEVTAAIPGLRGVGTDKPQIRFMDERGRLKCLPWLLLGQLLSGQLAQLVIDQRQQLLPRLPL